jgi:hypothetical protein
MPMQRRRAEDAAQEERNNRKSFLRGPSLPGGITIVDKRLPYQRFEAPQPNEGQTLLGGAI